LKEVNSLIFEFTTKYLSASSPLTNINMSSAFNAKKVIGGGSGEFAVITADSAAVEGEYTINEIISLAKEASIASSGAVSASADNKINLSTQLKDLALGTQLQFSSGFISFNINGNDFTFSESDTLNTVISTVNRSDAGVTMSYSSLSDGLTVKSKAKGADSAFVISDVSESNFFAAFNISGGTVNNGTNAVLRINNYMVEQNSNVFTIDGITYNLLKSTSNETSFVVTQDVDSIYNRIKGFIDGYNELVKTLNDKISEPVYRTFLPLTDSQRAEMSESEIKAWEEKSNSGMLNRDSNISQLLFNIRNAFSQSIEGLGITFAEIGITTGDWREKGLMHINETKLKNAIANNPQGVCDLFTKKVTTGDSQAKYNQSGLVERINISINKYTAYVKDTTLVYTERQIKDYSDKISRAIEKMNEKENEYYRQYAILEKAMASMNSQSNYFLSLLYGGF